MRLEDKIAELQTHGFCILHAHFEKSLIENCREVFWPLIDQYLAEHGGAPNRGVNRHCFAMPFEPPYFVPQFFFDTAVLSIVTTAMDTRIVADQWMCDVPLPNSTHQEFHADYMRPLFPETPDLPLPPYQLILSFGLIDITAEHGPIEIAPGTHRMPREEAKRRVESGEIKTQLITLKIGDVLLRHPWALHRGTPNTASTPRPLLTIRYARRWYADNSRDVNAIPRTVWEALTPAQQSMMRFPQA